MVLCGAEFDPDVLAVDIAGVLQTLPERIHDQGCISERRTPEKTYDRRRWVLRAER
jgi:hypothetical protein